MEVSLPNGRVLRLVIGDITKQRADAIVNAANSALAGGGGVDGAIHRAGGPSIMEELSEIRRRIGRCPTGSAVSTRAGALPARWVFHAVGPIYRDGRHGEPDQLRACYQSCLVMAEERGLKAITFPSISTGAYGYPVAEAAAVAIAAVRKHLLRDGRVQEATFVLFDQATYDCYASALRELFPSTGVEQIGRE